MGSNSPYVKTRKKAMMPKFAFFCIQLTTVPMKSFPLH